MNISHQLGWLCSPSSAVSALAAPSYAMDYYKKYQEIIADTTGKTRDREETFASWSNWPRP